MTIEAVFENVSDGVKFTEVYASKRKFLSVLSRTKKAVFLNAVDYERGCVIYPSTLPEYRQLS